MGPKSETGKTSTRPILTIPRTSNNQLKSCTVSLAGPEADALLRHYLQGEFVEPDTPGEGEVPDQPSNSDVPLLKCELALHDFQRQCVELTRSLREHDAELGGRKWLHDAYRDAIIGDTESLRRAKSKAIEAKKMSVDWSEDELDPDKLIAILQDTDNELSLADRLLANRATPLETSLDRQSRLQKANLSFLEFRSQLLGNPVRAWASDLATPSQEQVLGWVQKNVTSWLPALTGQATSLAVDIAIKLIITLVATFYFLVDGPTLIHSAMRLSPLDDDYEQQLIEEFDSISRAVVVATLLSALAQGLLAGIGFYFVGVDSVFLLTIMTMMLAMVPFLGAAAIWFPVCFWLAVVDGDYGRAIGLGIYGVAIISMADNVIKTLCAARTIQAASTIGTAERAGRRAGTRPDRHSRWPDGRVVSASTVEHAEYGTEKTRAARRSHIARFLSHSSCLARSARIGRPASRHSRCYCLRCLGHQGRHRYRPFLNDTE